MALIILCVWILCGIAAFGLTFGCFQDTYPELAYEQRKFDLLFALFIGCSGPVGLIASLIGSGGDYHFRFWPLSRQEAKDAFNCAFPHLNFDDYNPK